MNDQQRAAADEIVKLFKTVSGAGLTVDQIKSQIPITYIQMDFASILSNLGFHNILLHTPPVYTAAGFIKESGRYILTDKGWIYETYAKLLEEVKHKDDLEKALINSSIAANRSVDRVNRLFWVTVFLAAMSALGTIATVFIEVYKLKNGK